VSQFKILPIKDFTSLKAKFSYESDIGEHKNQNYTFTTSDFKENQLGIFRLAANQKIKTMPLK
jgi:hypothetical protein